MIDVNCLYKVYYFFFFVYAVNYGENIFVSYLDMFMLIMFLFLFCELGIFS